MKFEVKLHSSDNSPKKTERAAVAVDPDLKAELAKLPTKYFTENTRAFWLHLIEQYRKKAS